MKNWGMCEKIILALVIAALLMAVCLLIGMTVEGLAEGRTYYVAVGELNVRRRPTTESSIVCTRIRGDLVEATGKAAKGGWVEVCCDPLVGWVQYTMLSLEEPTNQAGVIAANGRVRLRDAPGGALIKWLQPGTDVTLLAVLEHKGAQWYRVKLGDTKGWVQGEYLQISKGP